MDTKGLLSGLRTAAANVDRIRCVRKPENYELFLDLYERVGYAPSDLAAYERWRQRSVQAWSELDQLLPGSCVGGLDREGRLVSGWGTLPISPTVVYGHSVCMERTLAGVASLYPAALYSLDWVDRLPGISHWAGSYVQGSGFTGRFQKSNFEIPNQTTIDVLHYVSRPTEARADQKIRLEYFLEDTLNVLSRKNAELVHFLRYAHPILHALREIATATLRNDHGNPLAVLLIPKALDEITASNVLDWVWVFPAENVDPSKLPPLLGQLDSLHGRAIELVVPEFTQLDIGLTPKAIPSFWVFTPRASMGALRQSIDRIFEHVIDKYPSSEIEEFARHAGL